MPGSKLSSARARAARRARRLLRRVRKKRHRWSQRWFSKGFEAPLGGAGDPKIFGIGLSETGTTSLHAALDLLGYRSASFQDMKERGLDAWLRGDFRPDYLDGYEAVTGLPIGCMVPELHARYPGSKFILTVRPIESWLASCEKQLSAAPDPASFDLAARRMAYGYSVYNEGAFRRAYEAHERDVRAFFADKPGELLVLDVLEGEGWDELCTFLDRPVPDQDFPHAKPGSRPGQATSLPGAPSAGAPESDTRLAPRSSHPVAVIPLVDPNHEDVTDYRSIEDLLKRTCMSLRQQRDAGGRIVVVGTRVPYWLDMSQDEVVFVDASRCPILDGRLGVRVDKGIKHILGHLVAQSLFDVELLYTVDADDFLHVDLYRTLREVGRERPDNDGFLWTRGLNVELRGMSDGTFDLAGAYVISDFNKACGTCRAFRGERLGEKLAADLPFFDELAARVQRETRAASLPVVRLSDALGSFIAESFSGDHVAAQSLTQTLGRHHTQEAHFELSPLDYIGAAKSCGHGQHDGPRKGAIHVEKVMHEVPREAFLESFGLVPSAGPSPLDLRSEAEVRGDAKR